MTRVQIPAYSDFWMMGDRYGEIVKTGVRLSWRIDPKGGSTRHSEDIAHVKLDKSGKTVKVVLADCTVI